MNDPRLLEKLVFEQIEVGNFGFPPLSPFPDSSDDSFSPKHLLSPPGLSDEHMGPATKEDSSSPFVGFDDAARYRCGGLSGSSPRRMRAIMGSISKRVLSESPASRKELKTFNLPRPTAIETLEKILGKAYHRPVTVTRVRKLPMTRKHVKEVFFLINHGISKVWVFKADPKKTQYELNAYWLAYKQGIPTGKPIGYTLNHRHLKDEYPFDVAILGGIVEHAGNPYNRLLRNMELQPRLIFDAAVAVSKLIAFYQVKLTAAQKLLVQYGVLSSRVQPSEEIKKRMLSVLRVEDGKAKPFMDACDALSSLQDTVEVVSHRDLHTGNIVTHETFDPTTHKSITSVQKFGVIDWESLGWDHPYSDVIDFWVHHQRQTRAFVQGEDYGLSHFLAAYQGELQRLSEIHHLSFKPLKERDSWIQLALWHLYEMFDPARVHDPKADVKAEYHYLHFSGISRSLESVCREESRVVRKELRALLSNTPYQNLLESKN